MFFTYTIQFSCVCRHNAIFHIVLLIVLVIISIYVHRYNDVTVTNGTHVPTTSKIMCRRVCFFFSFFFQWKTHNYSLQVMSMLVFAILQMCNVWIFFAIYKGILRLSTCIKFIEVFLQMFCCGGSFLCCNVFFFEIIATYFADFYITHQFV